MSDVPIDQRVTARRREQAFPALTPAEIDRLRRFAETRTYADGERLFAAGQPGPGLFVVLRGRVAITHPDGLGHASRSSSRARASSWPRSASCSGKSALVDGWAQRRDRGAPPFAGRTSGRPWWPEATLGERIMRALVLRRVSLIETGAGVLLIGRPDDHATARLMGF
jgi:thioredoxin reductase (NADPH)